MTVKSRYEIIWTTLKQEGTVKLAVPSCFHARVRKAVIKRKDIDLAYKLSISESNRRAYLRFESIENMLIVTLHTQVTLFSKLGSKTLRSDVL